MKACFQLFLRAWIESFISMFSWIMSGFCWNSFYIIYFLILMYQISFSSDKLLYTNWECLSDRMSVHSCNTIYIEQNVLLYIHVHICKCIYIISYYNITIFLIINYLNGISIFLWEDSSLDTGNCYDNVYNVSCFMILCTTTTNTGKYEMFGEMFPWYYMHIGHVWILTPAILFILFSNVI